MEQKNGNIIAGNRVWDLVSGKRVRPNPSLAEMHDAAGIVNQANIDSINKKLDDFEDVYNKALCLITKSIFDSKIYSVDYVVEDLVAT